MAVNGSKGSDYDAIVIGSGAGGLTCALQLASQGQSTLLLERRDAIGGFSRGEHADGYVWDHGGHLLFGLHPGGYLRRVFDHFKITDGLDLVPLQDTMRAVFPDREVFVPLDRRAFEEQLCEKYPKGKESIIRFLDLVHSLAAEVMAVSPVFQLDLEPKRGMRAKLRKHPMSVRIRVLVKASLGGPGKRLLKQANHTLSDLLDEAGVDDPEIRTDLSVLSILFGVKPSEVSALGLSIFYASALREQFMPRRGFRTMGEALERRLKEQGGTVRTSAAVKRIHLEGRRVAGVELENGDRISARAVVGDISPLLLVDLVGADHLPSAYVNRIRSMRPSASIFQVMVGSDVKIPDGTARLTGLFGTNGIRSAVAEVRDGKVSTELLAVLASPLSHPEYAPAGSGSYKLEMFVPYAAPQLDWDKCKQELADEVVKGSEVVLPGLSKHVRALRIRTPLDLERDTGVPFGTALGWDLIPSQSGVNRTPPVTPVKGLYLTGAWTQPGPGVSHVVISGLHTASLVVANS